MPILNLQDPADFLFFPFPLIKYLHRKYRKGKIRLIFLKKCLEEWRHRKFNITLPENIDISSDDKDFTLANLELFELHPIGASSDFHFVRLLGVR